MYKKKRIAVVVPAYNEERLIAETIDTMPKFVDRIIAVDDKSTDSTLSILIGLKRHHPNLTIIKHGLNKGVGASIITGYLESIKQEMDIAVVMAGDAQMDPLDLPGLLDPIVENKVDYVKGNRLVTKTVRKNMPALRFFGNSLLTVLTKVSSGYWNVRDPQCGYSAVTIDALKELPLHRVYKRYGFPNDFLTKLNVYDFRVKDVPVKAVYGKEVSGIKLYSYIPKVSMLLLRDFAWRLKEKYFVRDFHPIFLFYSFGLSLLVFGFLLGLTLLYQSFQAPIKATFAVFVMLLLTSGLQLTLFAIWQDSEYSRN